MKKELENLINVNSVTFSILVANNSEYCKMFINISGTDNVFEFYRQSVRPVLDGAKLIFEKYDTSADDAKQKINALSLILLSVGAEKLQELCELIRCSSEDNISAAWIEVFGSLFTNTPAASIIPTAESNDSISVEAFKKIISDMGHTIDIVNPISDTHVLTIDGRLDNKITFDQNKMTIVFDGINNIIDLNKIDPYSLSLSIINYINYPTETKLDPNKLFDPNLAVSSIVA